MVYRYPCKCRTCDATFALRVGIGHESSQRHFFLCPFCEEECSISLALDFNQGQASISSTENCTIPEDVNTAQTCSYKVVNLHPDYIVPFDQRHQDGVFPWLKDTLRFYEVLKEYDKGTHRLKDMRDLINFNKSFVDNWQILNRAWSLVDNNRLRLSRNVLKAYRWIYEKGNASLWSALHDFSRGMLFPERARLLEMYGEFLEEIRDRHADGLAAFIAFYEKTFREENFRRYRQVFDEYFRDFSEYKQTLNYIRCGVELPRGSFASSRGFERVKMFYGNAFEALSSNFVVPACLNNLWNNREFDRFETMDLSKYLSIDKSGRGNPFANNSKINFLLESVNTTIRNASHHGSIRLLKGRDIIEYRSGGTGARREMSYAEYIHHCNTLMMNLFIMFAVELKIAEQ